MMTFGFYQDVHRIELLKKAKALHPHGLLVCGICRWAWLTMKTAKISYDGTSEFGVCCMNEFDCYRRNVDKVG